MTENLEHMRESVLDVQPSTFREISFRDDDDTPSSKEQVIALISNLVQTALSAETPDAFWQATFESLASFHALSEAWKYIRTAPAPNGDLHLLDRVEQHAGSAHRHLLEQAMNMFDHCARVAKQLKKTKANDRARDIELARSFNSWLVLGSWLFTAIAHGTRRSARNAEVYDHLFQTLIQVAGEAAADADEAWRLRFPDPDEE